MLILKILKKSITILVLMLSIGFMNSTTYAKEQLPKINFLGMEHSPLVVGDKGNFYVTSNYEGMVQYRVWINKVNTNIWEDITEGYTTAVDAKIPYIISPDRVFAEGKYKLSVWVKRAEGEGVNKGSKGTYDTYYVANLNCVKKDNNNRIYVNNAMDIEKEEYTIGEEVIIKGIHKISGIKGPYKYKLHYFSPSKASDKNSGWVKNVTDYDDKIVWTPTEPGIYVLDVHVNTEASTTWNTYLKKSKENKLDNLAGTYEAWKLKIITVKEKTQDEEKTNIEEPIIVIDPLEEDNPEIIISGNDTGVDPGKNDTSVVTPGGNTGGAGTIPGTTPGNVSPPVNSQILKGISVVLDNEQEIIASGDSGTVSADISMFKDSDKLLYIDIKVNKDCTLQIKGVTKKFSLKANQSNKISMNDLDPDIDKENDGVSLINLKNYLADKDGYVVTNQKLTYEGEIIEVILKIKVK